MVDEEEGCAAFQSPPPPPPPPSLFSLTFAFAVAAPVFPPRWVSPVGSLQLDVTSGSEPVAVADSGGLAPELVVGASTNEEEEDETVSAETVCARADPVVVVVPPAVVVGCVGLLEAAVDSDDDGPEPVLRGGGGGLLPVIALAFGGDEDAEDDPVVALVTSPFTVPFSSRAVPLRVGLPPTAVVVVGTLLLPVLEPTAAAAAPLALAVVSFFPLPALLRIRGEVKTLLGGGA